MFNDLTHPGSITAIRVEGTKLSTDQRINNLTKELVLEDKKLTILDSMQSKFFGRIQDLLRLFRIVTKIY